MKHIVVNITRQIVCVFVVNGRRKRVFHDIKESQWHCDDMSKCFADKYRVEKCSSLKSVPYEVA